jgi:hypothetical protein
MLMVMKAISSHIGVDFMIILCFTSSILIQKTDDVLFLFFFHFSFSLARADF